MPLSDIEWDSGARADSGSVVGTIPVGEYDDEKRLLVAFLSENADNAYAKTEVIRGVDFGNDARPEKIRDVLTEIQDQLADVARDIVASGMLIDDIHGALDERAAEGAVATKDIETSDGTTTHYRLETDEDKE